MTERKGFKRLVRSRMQRTGESYATAHRHLSAQHRTLPPGLVAGYTEFGGRAHRESALVRHLLAVAGVPLSEPMACGLGGGIGFMYAVFAYAGMPHPLLTIVAQHHPQPWAPAVLDHLGVGYTQQHSSSTAAGMAKLRDALEDGRAAWCTVDRSALPWHAAVPPEAAADPYAVVVAGVDGDTLYVDDVAHTPHQIGVEAFAAAWAGHRKGRHHLLTVTGTPAAADQPTAVRAALHTTRAHLTGPVLGTSFDVNFGLSGMAKLAGELRGRGKRGWTRRFGSPEGFGHALARLEACLQREYTAADATRPVYADFLEEAGALLSEPVLAEAAALCRASGAGWAALSGRAVQAARAGMPGEGGRRQLFEELAQIVDSCAHTERQLTEVLAAIG